MKFSLEEFNPTIDELRKISDEYGKLEIKWVDDKEWYEQVKLATKDLQKKRLYISNTLKDYRAEAISFQKKVIEQEKKLLWIIQPLEKKLISEYKRIDEQKEIEKRKKWLPKRKELMEEKWVTASDDFILAMDFDRFNAWLLEEEKRLFELEKEKIEKEKEEMRKEKERIEQEKEREKIKKDAEKRAKEEAKKEAEKEKEQAVEMARKEAEKKATKEAEERAREADKKRREKEKKEREKKDKENAEKVKSLIDLWFRHTWIALVMDDFEVSISEIEKSTKATFQNDIFMPIMRKLHEIEEKRKEEDRKRKEKEEKLAKVMNDWLVSNDYNEEECIIKAEWNKRIMYRVVSTFILEDDEEQESFDDIRKNSQEEKEDDLLSWFTK